MEGCVHLQSVLKLARRGGREVYRAALEMRSAARHREFESHPLRRHMKSTYTGIVQKGIKRGQALGFPTANISLDDHAVSGIYAARVALEGKEYSAAAFVDHERKVLEAHVLDFSGDLYGKEITIELLQKIRDNKKFENDNALRAAIADDVARIRAYFQNV